MHGTRFLLVLLYASTMLFAQERHPIRLNRGGVSLGSLVEAPVARAAKDTLRILALRVDFQPDTDTLTSGSGKFLLVPPVGSALDPPPHDSAYSAYKLLFLENYFRKVSRGRVIVKGVVLSKIVTLSQRMATYSPPKDGSNDARLATMAIESWRKADSLFPGFPFSGYDAFLLFHAGVGRDIDLVSLLGFDPTPNDIPSITLTLKGFREYLKDPSFQGISVSGGTFRITNTLVLPETESRVILSGSRTDTLHLSINGLLASSFGTFLGLPDLFDTKTGRSGIGRFGLMDGAAIFAYNGLFPPEPSAWEKIYLGWTTPVTIAAGTQSLSLPAAGLTASPDTIFKVSISDREYFLIENRSRDPHGNGQRLTIVDRGSVITRSFGKDTTGFRFDDVRGISGSVIDVEDFDWALPGLTGIGEEFAGGGILIWHIDEEVIARELATNTINANPSKRGVDLEEADGSQDIGQSYDLLEPGFGAEFGTPLDFWFLGNPAPVYRNVFDDKSYPNSKSNAGAQSLISVREFGKRSPRMSLTVQAGNDKVKRLQNFSRSFPGSSQRANFPSSTASTVVTSYNNSVYVFNRDGTSRTSSLTGLLSAKGGQFEPASFEYDPKKSVIVGVQDSSVYIWNLEERSVAGVLDVVGSIVVPLGRRATTPPLFADLTIQRFIVVGGEGGAIWQITLNGNIQETKSVSSSPISSITQLPTPILAKPNQLYFAAGGRLHSESTSIPLGGVTSEWILAGAVSSTGNAVIAAEKGGRRVVGYNSALSEKLFEYELPEGSILSLAAADVDRDGSKEIVILSDARLVLLNRIGKVMDGFPTIPPSGGTFTGTPLVGDLDGDGRPDLTAMTAGGELIAFDTRGKILPEYPLQVSSPGKSGGALFETTAGKVGIVVLTERGSMQAVEIQTKFNFNVMPWTQYLVDALHTNADYSFTPNAVPPSSEYLPASRVYNWPNPVYGQTTQIRYYVPEDANITVKIFDLAGAKITELTDRARGGVDNEITWNVENIQSGIYLARIEATGNKGNHIAVIKIAVVK